MNTRVFLVILYVGLMASIGWLGYLHGVAIPDLRTKLEMAQNNYETLYQNHTSLLTRVESMEATLEQGLVKPPDLIVDEVNGIYRVIDGRTGDLVGQYTEAGAAITAAIGSGEPQKDVKHVVCKGYLNLSTQIRLTSSLLFEFDTLDFNALPDEAALVIDDEGRTAVHNLWIKGTELRNSFIGLTNASPYLNSSDIHINIGVIRDAKHQAVLLDHLFGEIWIDYLRTDNVGVHNNATWVIDISNIDGLTIGEISMTRPNQYGIRLGYINSLWARSIFVDSAQNDGIFLELIANGYIDRLVAHLCPGTGIVLRYPKSVNVNQMAASLCGGDGVAIEYTGTYATQIGSIHVNHCGAMKADGCAVRFVEAQYTAIQSLQAIDDYPTPVMKHAIVEDALSDHNQVGQLNTFGLTDVVLNSDATHSKYPRHWELPNAIPVGASPFTYRNRDCCLEDIVVQGGSVTCIEFSRDGSTWVDIGSTVGSTRLAPGDYLKITYSTPPNMTKIPM
jgi:hypothetical protein